MMRIKVPSNLHKLKEQKEALECLLSNDTSEKDKEIHFQALKEISNALKELE